MDGVYVPERELRALSALTGLTRLVLSLPCPLEEYHELGGDIYMCAFVLACWPVALLVSGMAELAELSLPDSNICAQDLCALAALTALTKLECLSLTTPSPKQCGVGQQAAANWVTAAIAARDEGHGVYRGDSADEDELQQEQGDQLGGAAGEGDSGAAVAGGSLVSSGSGLVSEVPRVPLPPQLRVLKVGEGEGAAGAVGGGGACGHGDADTLWTGVPPCRVALRGGPSAGGSPPSSGVLLSSHPR
jgi:hypothetical protein